MIPPTGFGTLVVSGMLKGGKNEMDGELERFETWLRCCVAAVLRLFAGGGLKDSSGARRQA